MYSTCALQKELVHLNTSKGRRYLTGAGEDVARGELSPVLEAMANASDPEGDDDGEDGAGAERNAQDVGAQPLWIELREGSRRGHGWAW
jgi:hypothetical protein